MMRRSDGFALVDVLFVCGIVGILCSIALPRLLMARQSASAASAIGSMRTISSAQLQYALTCGGGFYAPDLVALGRPPLGSNASFLPSNLATGTTVNKAGYAIKLAGTPFAGAPASCNGLAAGATARGFKAGADALEPTNARFFATNAAGQIFEYSSSMYPTMPEVGTPAAGHVLH